MWSTEYSATVLPFRKLVASTPSERLVGKKPLAPRMEGRGSMLDDVSNTALDHGEHQHRTCTISGLPFGRPASNRDADSLQSAG